MFDSWSINTFVSSSLLVFGRSGCRLFYWEYTDSFTSGSLFPSYKGWVKVYLLMAMIGLFLSRSPYMTLFGYSLSLLCFMAPFSLAVSLMRWFDFKESLASLIPTGLAWWVGVFVSYIEALSYFVRPFITSMRPVMNMAVGMYLMSMLWESMDHWSSTGHSSGSWLGWLMKLLGMGFFLLYEWGICCVQWFILKILIRIDSGV